jgi:uncharacterized protein (TIGR02611 family)
MRDTQPTGAAAPDAEGSSARRRSSDLDGASVSRPGPGSAGRAELRTAEAAAADAPAETAEPTVDPTAKLTEAPGRLESGWWRLRAYGRRLHRRIYALPGGRMALRLVIAAAGGVFVLLGLVLVPLPGPGWAIVIGGLAIWAIEFVWARHLLGFVQSKLRAWTRWVGRQPLAIRGALCLAGAGLLVLVGWLWLRYHLGFETVAQFWRYITTH